MLSKQTKTWSPVPSVRSSLWHTFSTIRNNAQVPYMTKDYEYLEVGRFLINRIAGSGHHWTRGRIVRMLSTSKD